MDPPPRQAFIDFLIVLGLLGSSTSYAASMHQRVPNDQAEQLRVTTDPEDNDSASALVEYVLLERVPLV